MVKHIIKKFKIRPSPHKRTINTSKY